MAMRNGSPVLALSATFQGVRSAPTDTVGDAADGRRSMRNASLVHTRDTTSSGENERSVWVMYTYHLELAYTLQCILYPCENSYHHRFMHVLY